MAASQKNTSYEKKNHTTNKKSTTKSKDALITKGKKPAAKKKNNQEKRDIFIENRTPYYNEIILGSTLVLSGLLILSLFGLVPKWILWMNEGVFGLIGILGYIFPFGLFISVAFAIANQKNTFAKRKLMSVVGLFFIVTALLQLLSTGYQKEQTILDYFSICAKNKSGGGLIGGFLMTILCKCFGTIATYLILIVVSILLIMFITDRFIFSALGRKGVRQIKNLKEYQENRKAEREYYYEENVEEENTADSNNTSEITKKAKVVTFPKNKKLEYTGELDTKTVKKKMKQASADTLEKEEPQELTQEEKEAILRAQKKTKQEYYEKRHSESASQNNILSKDIESDENSTQKKVPLYKEAFINKFKKKTDSTEKASYIFTPVDVDENNTETQCLDESNISIYDPIEEETVATPEENLEKLASPIKTSLKKEEIQSNPSDSIETVQEQSLQTDITSTVEMQESKPYIFPPIDLLGKPSGSQQGMSDKEINEKAIKLKQTLESFGVRVTITDVSCGPAVTRFELQPEQGVKVSKITGLTDDIKLNLAAADIRIEAPIPGKAAVGIEVPNRVNTMVMLRDLMESKEFKSHKSNVSFAVGKDIAGKTVVTDIAKMPHLLIAGATGSGKSVCINTLIMSILYKADPKDVKLIMIDPKVVELSVYNGIPHLLIPVVTDPKKASAALNWAVVEMTDRYNKFAELGVREINGYNEKISTIEDANDPRFQKMAQIVIIVDELADLMMVAPGEVEESICRLAQLARAAGIHLVIATQRPSVNVITGLIKANIPSRIAFAVSSAIDSRTILDGGGAEKLLGKGDMLFFPSGFPKPVRVQGAFVSDKEVTAVVDFLKQQAETPQYNEAIHQHIETNKISDTMGQSGKSNRDDYFIEAGKFIIEKDKASIGMLQRVFKVGFNRAARIMDQLSEAGVVGAEEGTKPRKVLMSLEQFENYIDEYN